MSKEVSASQIKKNMAVSVAAQVISLIVSFIMNLILPKFISEYQYACWQTYLLYVGYVGILHFGLLDGIVLRYSQFNYDELDKPRIRSQFKILLVITSAFSIIGIITAGAFAEADMKIVFVFAALGIITRNLFTYTSYTFQMTNRITKYAEMIISYRVFYGIVVTAMMLLGLKEFYWYCIADLCSDLFGVLIGSLHNKGLYFGKSIKLTEAVDELLANISAGAVLMLANSSSFFLTGSARLIIQWHWNEITFGKVSFALSITNLFLTFVTAISVVLFPSLKRTDPWKLPELYKQIRNSVSPFLSFILIFYYPGCFILRKWLPAYNESLIYLGVLLPLIIFSSKESLLTNNYLKAYREEGKLLLINLISVILAVTAFSVCAYVLDSLMALIVCIVGVLAFRSIVSETVVMRITGLEDGRDYLIEIVMSVVFIVSAVAMRPAVGFAVYSAALVLYFILYRKSEGNPLGQLWDRMKK